MNLSKLLNMKVAMSIKLGFSLITALLIGVGTYSIFTFDKISDLTKEISKAEAAQDYIHVLIDQQ